MSNARRPAGRWLQRVLDLAGTYSGAVRQWRTAAARSRQVATDIADLSHALAGPVRVVGRQPRDAVVEGGTTPVAIEYAARGVRVNTVSPGIIRTPMHAEETCDTLAALHPVGRMGDVADIVEAIAYLETAEFVTGEILHVDGGQSAGH